jgi:hypothetical protein
MRLLRLTSALIDPSIIHDNFDRETSVTFLNQTFARTFHDLLFCLFKHKFMWFIHK